MFLKKKRSFDEWMREKYEEAISTKSTIAEQQRLLQEAVDKRIMNAFGLKQYSASSVTTEATPTQTLSKEEMNKLIEEIHETFNTEVDRLLEYTGVTVAPSTIIDTKKIDKSNRLKQLGFGQSKTVNDAKKDEEELRRTEEENRKRSELREAILYFQVKYPSYKFITLESIEKICAKYSLIYGDVSKYIGDVPEKNIAEMEAFKVDEDDVAWSYSVRGRKTLYSRKNGIDMIAAMNNGRYHGETFFSQINTSGFEVFEEKIGREGFMIAAPKSDFDTRGMEVNKFKLEAKVQVPDPVVFQPVMYKDKEFFLICTCWGGPEASDPLVVNEKMN